MINFSTTSFTFQKTDHLNNNKHTYLFLLHVTFVIVLLTRWSLFSFFKGTFFFNLFASTQRYIVLTFRINIFAFRWCGFSQRLQTKYNINKSNDEKKSLVNNISPNLYQRNIFFRLGLGFNRHHKFWFWFYRRF